MKTILQSVLAVALVISFASCDKVEGPYKKSNTPVTPGPDTPLVRKVLVEDYTGHKCGNCPRASKSLYNLKQLYGDRLIIMGIHAGSFATILPPGAPYYTTDFRTQTGNDLDTDFGISLAGNPNGMVNRRMVSGSYIISSTAWSTEVANVLSSTDPVPVKLTIETSFDATSRQLQVDVTSEFFTTLSGTHKLCVFMIEDSIVDWQKDYDVIPNDVPDYTHREVLRGSMNGTYGAVVAPTTEGSSSTLTYTSTLNASWNEDQFSVIAFIYDEATKEIIQVEQKHLDH